jgi:histidinol-phosphate/aromatic aminotransferase/cobyric acid decarboxylase-like protein
MSQHILDQITLGALVIVRDKMLAQQAAGRKVYRLEVGDTSFDTPPHIRQAILEALESGKTHYPPSTGLPALREAALRKVREENCLPIRDADHVMVTIGGMHGLYMAFSALLDPGDQVILPDPMWSEIAAPLDERHSFDYAVRRSRGAERVAGTDQANDGGARSAAQPLLLRPANDQGVRRLQAAGRVLRLGQDFGRLAGL